MKKTLTALLLASSLGLSGCKEVKIETSELLHENGIVINKIYTPSKHETNVRPRIDGGDGMMGFGGDGYGIAMGSLVFTSSEVPEKYAVVYKCQHDIEFIIQGEDKWHRSLWSRMEEGEKVNIRYKEVFRAVYDDKDKDGKKELVSRTFIDYDFIDAEPLEESK